MTKRRILLPESDVNAEALARRDSTYSAASDASFRWAYDYHRREPQDLREAVRIVRRAYADEVPGKLHDAAIGDDGTPRMTAKAEGYIFGNAQSDDAGRDPVTGQRDLVGYHHTPFRATLAAMAGNHATHPKGYVCGNADHRRAAIVSHITIGSQGPQEAAITEGVPAWCAKVVAWDALCSFLRSMTDLRLHLPDAAPLSEGATAA